MALGVRRFVRGFAAVVTVWLGSIALPVLAADAKPQGKITYADQIRPIFREHCFNCHNQNKATNDLALDTYERIRKGGASGEAIQPGDPDNSYLWQLVNHQSEPHMPPSQDKMPAAKLDLIKQWIAGGALKDSGSKSEPAKKATVSLALSTGAAKPSGPAILPEGLAKQPVTTPAHSGAVTAIAASPWAPVIAVAGQKQISLYHSDSAQLLGILPFPEGIPYVLRFSRSGAVLLAGGGQNVKRGLAVAFDVRTGKRLFEVGDELDAVLAADISPDLSKVALGGPEKVVRVFGAADGRQLYELRKHTDWIYGAEFSPDGVLLATSDRSGGLLVWEAETGREFHNLEGHKGGVTAVSFRDDGNILASGSEDGTIKLWTMEDGKEVKSFGAHGDGVTCIGLTHDGRLVSSGRDRLVKVWDLSGKQLRAFDAMKELAMKAVFTHDGKRVAAGDWSGEIRLWDVESGKQIGTLAANPPATPASSPAKPGEPKASPPAKP